MKKNDWLLAGTVATYSYLFYEQQPGINYLLFTLLLLGLIVYQTKTVVFRKITWQLTAIASLVSGVNVVLANSNLAVLANLVSLVLLAGYSRMPETSIFITAANSVYSLVSSFFNFTFFREKFFPESAGPRSLLLAGINLQQVTIIGIPVLVTAGFVAIYYSASATFSYLVRQIDFSFISFYLILFTFTGFWLLFGFFRQQLILEITEPDLATGNNLFRTKKRYSWAIKILGLKYEFKAGVILLILLNALLFIFNLSDAYYLTVGEMPKGIIYSEYLHQGVYLLIFSILMAIGVLLYLFRGNQNFFAKNKPLRLLAYSWLTQNLILVLITVMKNGLYVMEFGLTHKRIGVYTYLTLTTIGLITSFVKVAAIKNNWFLFRKNAWAVYLVLILASCLNWDRFITGYNLKFTREPDLEYLLSLSDSNFGQVYQFVKFQSPDQPDEIVKRLENRRQNVLKRIAQRDWQAWNYDDHKIQEELGIEFTPLFNL